MDSSPRRVTAPVPMPAYQAPVPVAGGRGDVASRVLALATATIGGLVLSGWLFDLRVFRTLGPANGAAMNPTAALTFVALSAALWLVASDDSRPARIAARGIAILVIGIGAVRIATVLADSGFPVDSLLFGNAMRQTVDGRTNHMSTNAAFDFMLLGAALLLCTTRRGKARVAAQALSILVLFSCLTAFVAHVYQSGWFESVGSFNRMPLHTAIALGLASAGVLGLQRESGLVSVVLSDGPGGTLARALLPAALIVPAFLGWLALLGRRSSFIPTDVVEMLFVVTTTMVFLLLVCWTAMQLHEAHVERLRTEDALRDSEVRFRLIAENGSDVVTLHDLSGRVTYVSPSCERVLGFGPEELLRMSPFALAHPDDAERLQRHVDALIRGEPVTVLSLRMLHKSGRHIWLEMMWRAVLGHDGRVVRLQAASRDITERHEYERKLEEAQRKLQVQQDHLVDANMRLETLATQDGLTGMKNRRSFEERLQEEAARTRRTGQPLSLLLIDIDHFKLFNDTFGHPSGDEVLREVARHLSRAMRDTDFAARYGGEEFAVLLPDTDREGAELMGERLRVAIESAVWERRAITISVGAAALQCEGTVQHLVESADRALYRSKQSGRNCVTLAA